MKKTTTIGVLAITAMLVGLVGCAPDPTDRMKMKLPTTEMLTEDLARVNWEENVELLNSYDDPATTLSTADRSYSADATLLPYTFISAELVKQDATEKDATVWFRATLNNTKVEYAISGTVAYHYYTQGGWQIESCHIDSNRARAIAPPTIIECYQGWNDEWNIRPCAPGATDGEFVFTDITADLNASPATATFTCNDVTCWRNAMSIPMTITAEFTDEGWKCVSTNLKEITRNNFAFDFEPIELMMTNYPELSNGPVQIGEEYSLYYKFEFKPMDTENLKLEGTISQCDEMSRWMDATPNWQASVRLADTSSWYYDEYGIHLILIVDDTDPAFAQYSPLTSFYPDKLEFDYNSEDGYVCLDPDWFVTE